MIPDNWLKILGHSFIAPLFREVSERLNSNSRPNFTSALATIFIIKGTSFSWISRPFLTFQHGEHRVVRKKDTTSNYRIILCDEVSLKWQKSVLGIQGLQEHAGRSNTANLVRQGRTLLNLEAYYEYLCQGRKKKKEGLKRTLGQSGLDWHITHAISYYPVSLDRLRERARLRRQRGLISHDLSRDRNGHAK